MRPRCGDEMRLTWTQRRTTAIKNSVDLSSPVSGNNILSVFKPSHRIWTGLFHYPSGPTSLCITRRRAERGRITQRSKYRFHMYWHSAKHFSLSVADRCWKNTCGTTCAAPARGATSWAASVFAKQSRHDATPQVPKAEEQCNTSFVKLKSTYELFRLLMLKQRNCLHVLL